MKRTFSIALTLAAALGTSGVAFGHSSIASGPGYANKTSVVEFGLGHGCAGFDTYTATVDLPAGITSVRPMYSDVFNQFTTVVDPVTTQVTNITWQKDDTDLRAADEAYYKVNARMKVPDMPFTTLYFGIHHICKNPADQALYYEHWVLLPGEVGGVDDGPAAAMNVLPPRLPGWNKYTVSGDMADLSIFFQDALIVWRGDEAYSFNDNTVELINTTAGASLLPDLKANDEIWVRY